MKAGGENSLCLVCSRGGHLEQMRELRRFYGRFDHFFVLPFPRGTAVEDELESTRYLPDINEGRGVRNPALLVRALAGAFLLLVRRRPRLIISTGAGIAVPVLVAARVLGIRSVYVESFARITRPSQSGRACYRLASLFIFQHHDLRPYYPRATYGGSIYGNL